MSRFAFRLLAALSIILSPVPAMATTLMLDSGWQNDTVTVAGLPTSKSAWTFTVTTAALLSITDYFIPGDIYTISGDLTGVTQFYAGSESDVQAAGFYGDAWSDDSYSKIALLVGPGTYSFSITGDGGGGGTPAGFGLRLDTSAVPEAASWVLMTVAFGMVGFAMRRAANSASVRSIA
jgi:hypothetical protein